MEVIEERKKTHGDFKVNSRIVQDLKGIMRTADGWYKLEAYQQEAIDMIFHKIGRILTGNPKFIDSWRDIAGYTELVIKELEKDSSALDVRQEYFTPAERPTMDKG